MGAAHHYCVYAFQAKGALLDLKTFLT